MFEVPFTDTEKICRYLCLNGFDYDPYLSGAKEPEGFTAEQIRTFREDVLTHFARKQDNVGEDVTIPAGSDVMILREARYLKTQLHHHEYIEFIYLLQGDCAETIGEKTYKMKPGDLFLLAPGTDHCGDVRGDDTLLFYIMVRRSTFEHAFLSLLSSEDALSVFFSDTIYKEGSNRFLLFHTGENPRIQDMVFRMFQGFDPSSRISNRRANLLFELICLEVIEHHLTDLHTRDKQKKDISIMSLLNYLDETLSEVTVESVAAHFGYSRGHMERLVKANTGFTLSDFILRIKMRHARSLLRNPSLTIHEVAESSGFSEDSSFYRAFKKFHNQTPSEYRKLHTNS